MVDQKAIEAAGKVIFGDMFAVPEAEDPVWVKQTWGRVEAALCAALMHISKDAMESIACCQVRANALHEAADWHEHEAARKRTCAVKNRTLRAQIATHLVSAAAIRSLITANVEAKHG
ncbi:hypothetical protein ABE527_16370 [Brucella sp. TWI432]